MMRSKKQDDEVGRVLFRMGIGATIGGIIFFAAFWFYAHATGFTEDRVNPYIQAAPTYASLVCAWYGIVIGAITSLISRRWKQ